MDGRTRGLLAVLTLSAIAGTAPAGAQQVIPVRLRDPIARSAFGVGGGTPTIFTGANAGPIGEATDGFQPASWFEWKVPCSTPGLYRIAITLSQYQDRGAALAFETRPFTDPDNPSATRYAAPDTRDYGSTNGPYAYMNVGDVQDAYGIEITVPLWAGDNVLRMQNVTDRHNPAFTVPSDRTDTRNREWGFYWSNVHVGSITLTRAGDLPAMATLAGTVTSNLPTGYPVRRAFVFANPPGRSPAEPGPFWKSGYYTMTNDSGAFTLSVPEGLNEVTSGRPGSYEVQGSGPRLVHTASAGASAIALTLTSAFHRQPDGSYTAAIPLEYAETLTGSVGLIASEGENGYKLGWVDAGDAATVTVDAPFSGVYRVASAYCNGGNTGTVRLSTDNGSTAQETQAPQGWATLVRKDWAQPLILRRGANLLTHTLVSGNSDMSSIRLTLAPFTAANAAFALKVAAGLEPGTSTSVATLDVDGDGIVTVADAAAIAAG